MILRVLSDYGKQQRLVSQLATEADIRETMNSLDWSGFHQVILERQGGDWFEAGGSLDPTDGLSMMYEEHGRQFVVETPPETVEEMAEALRLYLQGGEEWKQLYQWS